MEVREIAQVHAIAVVSGPDHLAYGVRVAGLAVGAQAHDLALVGVGLEAQIFGECGVQRADRVRELDGVQGLDLQAAPHGDVGRGALAIAVDGEQGGLLEGRAEERGRGVR